MLRVHITLTRTMVTPQKLAPTPPPKLNKNIGL